MVGSFIALFFLASRTDQYCPIRPARSWAFWCLQVAGVIFWVSWLVGLVGLKIDTVKWAALTAALLWVPLLVVVVLVSQCF
jgi:uncharacterized membrane protein